MKLIFTTALLAFASTGALAEDQSSDDVHWSIVMSINEGMEDNVVPLLTRMSDATMTNEPDALIYEYMRSGDAVHIYERYANNAAAMVHMGNFGSNFADDFFATFTVESIAVYGPAEDDLKEVFADAPAVYLEKIAGFAR
ncbi:antibiotic biosynthesis monooxygenase [Ruegeria arenilitoris]|uniref:antibiotic biosynthesis monooxygenase n=1 Tax=Ruegeria arenilitoris TaxID=1173585 RepID=UPI00147BBCDD|nr:antibiotic biosynthesis monooxygenase [Ruegeria arenilitoris]